MGCGGGGNVCSRGELPGEREKKYAMLLRFRVRWRIVNSHGAPRNTVEAPARALREPAEGYGEKVSGDYAVARRDGTIYANARDQ